MKLAAVSLVIVTTLPGFQADAQVQASPPVTRAAAPPVTLPPGECCVVPSGSIVEISIDEPLDSKTSKIGQRFPIHLTAPLQLADGHIVIAPGATGVGEVIQAARARMGGKPGELLLVARYLEVNGAQIPLRGFRLGGQGKDNSNLVMAATISIGVAGMLISGGEKRVPPGTIATAKIAVDTVLPPLPAPAPTLSPVVNTREIEK